MSFLMLLLLGLAPVADPPATAASVEDLRTRVHDLSGLLPAGAGAIQEIAPLPLVEQGDGNEAEPHGEVLAEALYGLLVDVLHEEELQYEQRRADYMDGPRLLLTAPEGVHDTLDDLTAYVRAASRRTAVLRVTRFSVPGGVLLADGMGLADVSALVSTGQLVPTDERRIEVLLGVPWHESSEAVVPLVQGWDLSIAQQATTHEAEIRQVAATHSLGLMVSPLPDGRYVVRMARRHDALRALDRRSLEPLAVAVGDSGLRDLAQNVRLELHRMGVATLLGSAVLAPGGEFLVAASTHTAHKPSAEVMAVGLESVTPLPAAPALGRGALRLVDLSAHTSRGGHAHDLRARWLGGRTDRFQLDGMQHIDIADANLFFPNEGIHHGDVLDGAWEALDWYDGSVWDDGPWALAWAEEAVIGDVLRGLSARLFTSTALILEWGLEDTDGHPLAGGVLPTAGDCDALALVGEAFGALAGSESEVATGAVAQEPRRVDLFDGLWLRLRPAGPGEVDVRLCRNASAGREQGTLGPELEGLFDRTAFDVAEVDRRVAVDGRRHELVQIGPADGRLALWVRATAR